MNFAEYLPFISAGLAFISVLFFPLSNQWADGKVLAAKREVEAKMAANDAENKTRIAAIESEHKTILARVSSVESAHFAITESLRKMQEEAHQAHQESIKAITELRLDIMRDYTNSAQVQKLIADLAADQKTTDRRINDFSKDVMTQLNNLENQVANMRGVCSIKGCAV